MAEKKITSIGERLLLLREQHKMTQEDLAKQLVVSRQSVSKWELNKALPDMDKLIQMSRLYHISIDYLVMGEEMKEKDELREMLEQEAVAEEKTEAVSTEAPLVKNGKRDNVLIRKYILLVCVLTSGILCLLATIFSIKILSGYGSYAGDAKQSVVRIQRIYEQYTKAEVMGDTEDGETFRSIAVLDIPGIKENDSVRCYIDSDNPGKPLFEYYSMTMWAPVISGIIIFIFFLVFLIEFISLKPNESRGGMQRE